MQVVVVGELDVYTAPVYREFVVKRLEEEDFRHLVVDLAEVPYFDSTALGATVLVLKRMRERLGGDGRLVVVGGEGVSNILRITGLSKILTMAASVEAALDVLGGPGSPGGAGGSESGEHAA